MGDVATSYYLRMRVLDSPACSPISRGSFADRDISIDAMIQKEAVRRRG